MSTAMDEVTFITMDPADLKTRPPFSNLLPIRPQTLKQVTEDMAEKGFDRSKPINVWKAENVIVDGHTRQKAAIEAGCDVRVCFHDFKDEDEAMEYAIHSQAHRRNLTDADLIRLVAVLDERRRRGAEPGGRGNQYTAGKGTSVPLPEGKSSNRTAELLGTNYKKIERARKVIDYANATGDTEEKKKIEDGRMSINMGADSVRIKAHKAKSGGETAQNTRPAPSVNGKIKADGVGITYANEAIDRLSRIPRDDPHRERGFQIVRDWMKFNR